MSSDDSFIIRVHPKGGFAAVRVFLSDDSGIEPAVTDNDQQFPSVVAACLWADSQNPEYGVMVSAECGDVPTDTDEQSEIESLFDSGWADQHNKHIDWVLWAQKPAYRGGWLAAATR